MSRPKKEIPPARPRRVTIRLTQQLYDVLKEDAARAHLSIAEYIRMILTGRHPVTHYEVTYDNPEILQIFRNLGGLAANMNQIARYLNQGGHMTDGIQEDISACISQLRSIRQDLKKEVGEYRGNSETH